MCWHSYFLPPNIPSAHKCEVSHTKRPSLLSQLALPYSRFASRRPSFQSRQKTCQVSPKSNGVESEPSSDVSSDMTSDLTDVTSNITDISSAPLSPGVLKNIEQGTLGAVVRGRERRMLGSILIPCVPFLPPSSFPTKSFSVVSKNIRHMRPGILLVWSLLSSDSWKPRLQEKKNVLTESELLFSCECASSTLYNWPV